MYNICDIDFDYDGRPGEYVFGERIYIPDEYLDELWKRDRDAWHYWVSTKGRVWSDVSNSFIIGSPVGRCGHIDMSLRVAGGRLHKYLHRMVAEAFIPNPHNYPLVRHLDDNPSNNYVDNLAWGTQGDNIRDAIDNGHFYYLTREDIERANQARRTPVKAIHIQSGREYEFISQREAARYFGIDQSSIQNVLSKKSTNAYGYYFYYAGEEPDDMSNYKYSRHFARIIATNIATGRKVVFRGQTEAARALGMSVSSVSMVLSGKQSSAKGYIFEYANEEEYYGD
jgi:predicted XRE-type DNA-binding protein